MTDKLLVLTTAGSEVEAQKIAKALIERRLAACVNIVPRVQSVYMWEGKLEQVEEYLMLIKTVKLCEERVYAAIRELHSYELPECISLTIENGSADYLKWLSDAVE